MCMERDARILITKDGIDNDFGFIKDFKKEKGLNEPTKLSCPLFQTPDGNSSEEYFEKICQKGLKEKFGAEIPKTVSERYEKEKSVIFKLGYTEKFLHYKTLAEWAKANNIFLSVDRGSAVGSLVCYLLDLTKINPLKYNLIFERFINTERFFSNPSIEFDVEAGKKEEVVEHIIKTFGAENCALTAEYSYPFIFKSDKENIALKTFIYVSNEPVKNKVALGKLDQKTYISAEPERIFEKSNCLKFVIQPAEYPECFKQAGNDLFSEPMNDPNIYSLIADNEINREFMSCESEKDAKEYYKKINPQNIEDLASVYTLLRESVIFSGITDDFIKTKSSDTKEYYCEALKPVLKDTYGVIIWQEQVIEILNIILEFGFDKSDEIRRSLAKQQISPKLKTSFINSAQKLGMSRQKAKLLWNKTEKAVPYCFMKSHAISGALMAYYATYCFREGING